MFLKKQPVVKIISFFLYKIVSIEEFFPTVCRNSFCISSSFCSVFPSFKIFKRGKVPFELIKHTFQSVSTFENNSKKCKFWRTQHNWNFWTIPCHLYFKKIADIALHVRVNIWLALLHTFPYIIDNQIMKEDECGIIRIQS